MSLKNGKSHKKTQKSREANHHHQHQQEEELLLATIDKKIATTHKSLEIKHHWTDLIKYSFTSVEIDLMKL